MTEFTYVQGLMMFVALTFVGSAILFGMVRLLVGLCSGFERVRRARHLVHLLKLTRSKRAWRDVVLPDDVKAELEHWQGTLVQPSTYRRRWGHAPPTGLVLHGPSGTGKGLVARTLAKASGRHVLEASFAPGEGARSEEAQRHLITLYEEARRRAPSLVLLRHVERGDPDQLALSIKHGRGKCQTVFTVGTTEHPDSLDGRHRALFPVDLRLELPPASSRERLFVLYTRPYRKRLDCSCDDLVRASDGLSGRDIRAVCEAASLLANTRGRRRVGVSELNDALARFGKALQATSTVTREPCFMCQGQTSQGCPVCQGEGYVEVILGQRQRA